MRRALAILRAVFAVLVVGVSAAVLLLAEPSARADAHAAPSASASAASSGSAAAPAQAGALVRVHERDVYVVRASRAGKSADERARAASEALESVLEDKEHETARVEEQGQSAVVYVGKTPIVTLGEEDATAAGDASLKVHALSVASKIDEGLRTERQRSAIANSVFSFSLLVFSALIAFLLLRRVGEVGTRISAWVRKNPQRMPALKLGKIEVVSRAAIRGMFSIALVIGHRLGQLAILYGWLLIALSLFESTRGYTERLTGFVLTPLSALLGRLGSALPLLVVTVVAILAVVLLVRFVGLFFGSVARGETRLGWLPADLAEPFSIVVRAGTVIVALILAAPLLTGSDEGALSRAGVATLVALGLACAPVLASAAVGIPHMFGRRMRTGDFIEVGGRSGRVRKVGLLEVELEDAFGCELRVPHLLSLVRPTRVLGRARLAQVEISIDPRASQGKAQETLMAAAKSVSTRATVELLSMDVRAARYRVTCEEGSGSLAGAIADALGKEGIALGAAGDNRP